MVCFPKHFYQTYRQYIVVLTPVVLLPPVWALPISLATTLGIEFFFLFLQVLRCFSSLRYLLMYYFTHTLVIRLLPLIEFPHSDIHGYNGYLLLPVAFRSLSRPSSALGAQAFTIRSLQLNLWLQLNFALLCQTTHRSAVMYYMYTPFSLACFPCIARLSCAIIIFSLLTNIV